MTTPQRWDIVTGEYPPRPGGVSDYSALLAAHLAATGDEVHVWFPEACGVSTPPNGVQLHRLPGHFGSAALRQLSRELNTAARPLRLLIQYAPHALGLKGMNLFFANWLKKMRALEPWTMFHEVAFPIIAGQPLKHRLLAEVQRSMARRVLSASSRCFVSVPAWNRVLQELSPGFKEGEWLPVPSNIPAEADPVKVAEIRQKYCAGGARLVGHFGTFGGEIAAAVRDVLPVLMRRDPLWHALLVGRGSREFGESLIQSQSAFNGRIHCTGAIEPGGVAAHLSAVDVLYQPYPDGITTRRGSAMAGLALGRPIVSNDGELSETIWQEQNLVVLSERGNADAAAAALERWSADTRERNALMERAREGYARLFSWEQTVNTLRSAAQNRTT